MSVAVVAFARCFTTHCHFVILMLFLAYLLQVMVAFFVMGSCCCFLCLRLPSLTEIHILLSNYILVRKNIFLSHKHFDQADGNCHILKYHYCTVTIMSQIHSLLVMFGFISGLVKKVKCLLAVASYLRATYK